jgi:hypothetical protein
MKNKITKYQDSMKRFIILSALCFCVLINCKAQTRTTTVPDNHQSYTILCESISTDAVSDFVENYFLSNYSNRVSSYVANLSNHTAIVTTDMGAEDVLQIFYHLGYNSIYLNETDHLKYGLWDGKFMEVLKAQ